MKDQFGRAEAQGIVAADEQFTVPTDGKPLRGLIQVREEAAAEPAGHTQTSSPSEGPTNLARSWSDTASSWSAASINPSRQRRTTATADAAFTAAIGS